MEFDPKMIWFVAGFVLILLEFAAPGIVIVFFGFGAWVVAAGMWMGVIESLATQCAVFGIASLLSLFLLRRFVSSWFVGGILNKGCDVDEEFVGKKVRVVRSIGGGQDTGKVELKGAEWSAYCEVPMEAGRHAKVVKRDGINLIVEPND